MSPPLIVTLKLDAASFDFFDELRQKHFPPERNFLRAHVTLFHHLPASEISRIEADLQTICNQYESFALQFPSLRFLGKGTAAEIESPNLLKIRSTLAAAWQNWLTAQDRQKFKPHITIQNKVAPVEAKQLFENLQSYWRERKGVAAGLQLWRYLGAPWELKNEFKFGARDQNAVSCPKPTVHY